MRWVGVGLGVVLVVAACGGAGEERSGSDEPAAEPRPVGEWVRLQDPPLSPRTQAVAAWTGEEVVVVGGWDFLCPPGADCAMPQDQAFADGAAFDPASGTWREIADAPLPLRNADSTVVDGVLYVFASEGRTLMRYRPDDDKWDTLDDAPELPNHTLTEAGGDLVAVSTSDENGAHPDWRYDPAADSWHQLPEDPLSPSFDRQVVADGDELLLFATPIDAGNEVRSTRAARLAGDRWEVLPDGLGPGYRAWPVDDVVVIEPHFGPDGGGVFTPATDTWSELPSLPEGSITITGVLGAERAIYEAPGGWVLDAADGEWHEVPQLDLRQSSATTAAGRDMFVFGGERWDARADGDGELLGDAHIWTAP
jgi:hypothetical protein